LNDLALYGGSQFALHVSNLENKTQQKNAIELIGGQFISLKEFIEKLNTIVKEFLQLSWLENIKELMKYISKTMPVIFNAEKVLLWTAEFVRNLFFKSYFIKKIN